MGTLIVEFMGREFLRIEAHLRPLPGGAREVVIGPDPAAALPPVAVVVPGPGHALADTAFADHGDPETRGMGFGYPMRPGKDRRDRESQDRA